MTRYALVTYYKSGKVFPIRWGMDIGTAESALRWQDIGPRCPAYGKNRIIEEKELVGILDNGLLDLHVFTEFAQREKIEYIESLRR